MKRENSPRVSTGFESVLLNENSHVFVDVGLFFFFFEAKNWQLLLQRVHIILGSFST